MKWVRQKSEGRVAQNMSTASGQLPWGGSWEGGTQSPTRGAQVRLLMQCCSSRPQMRSPFWRRSSLPHLRPVQAAAMSMFCR